MKIYLVPFLIDFILFMVQSRLSDAAGREMKLSNSQATSLLVAFSLAYLVACPFAARVVDAKITKTTLLLSLAAILFLGLPLLFVVSFWPALWLISGVGAAAAFAFNSFQSFMRGRSPQGELAATIAKYTVSWSLGIGLGFLLSGVLLSFGQPVLLAALCAAAIVGIVAMIAGDKPAPLDEKEEAESSTRLVQDAANPRFGDARYVAIGWSLCLSANFVQRPLATFVPKFSAQAGNSAWIAGVLLCALLCSQAVSAFVTYKRTDWLYSARSLIVMQVGIALALCGLWISHSYVASLLLMAIVGLLHGWGFFCAVFYCNNSLRSARNVGINEMSVSIGNISGMILCNAAIRWMNDERAFYPTTIAFSLLMLGAQIWWLRGAPVVAPSDKETAAAI